MRGFVADLSLRIAVYATIATLSVMSATAQPSRKAMRSFLFSDTMVVNQDSRKKADQFYDSLQKKRHKSWIVRTATRLLIVGRDDSDASIPNTEMEIAQKYFGNFTGKVISEIQITQANVFEQRNKSQENWAERFFNSLHVLTKERQLRQNLLFKEGDKIDPYRMAINEKLVRGLPYISTAFFVVTPDKNNPEKVIVSIFARDNWTISGDLEIATSSMSTARAYDRNFIGSANKLMFTYYYRPDNHSSDGLEALYSIDNLWGTFANVDITAGIGPINNMVEISASRPFILPSDHIYGLNAGYKQYNASMLTMDTTTVVNRQEYEAWYGYSLNIDREQGTNIYMTLGGDYVKYQKRHEVSKTYNPFYHNQWSVLTSIGLARQNYFQGNMIYGYGRTEDVPYGYRFDITGGLNWDEFLKRRHYISTSLAWAEMMKFGYVNAKVGIATFVDNEWNKTQGMAIADLRYFTPLYRIHKHYLRQFLNISAVWGFNRLKGDYEELSYTKIANVRGISTGIENMGYNRLTIGAENVMFTPLFFYNFRFAFNVWGDIGWLGYDNRMFANPVSSAVGIGVRIRNERLIFKSFALRLGVSLRRPPRASFNPFQSTSEEALRMENFTPSAPRVMPYR